MRSRSVVPVVILTVFALLLGAIGYVFAAVYPINQYMKLGLDLKGGVHMVLEAVDSEVGEVTDEGINAAINVLYNRIDKFGVAEPVIQREGDRRIIVQIADELDVNKAREMIGKTAVLQFIESDGTPVLDGKDVADAGIAQNPGGDWVVTLKLKGEGPRKFEEATTRLAGTGEPIIIMLDDAVISAPIVTSPIPGGEAIIEGNFTAEEADELAKLIEGGALPLKLDIIESRTVTATLGMDSLARSARAGLLGIALVALFMLLVYRVPGLMAILALVSYAYMTIAFLIGINATFTLPGLAGLLLSMGMAVDANVIIFERVREELRIGKGLRSAIDAGFTRALGAIIDGNVTTVLAGLVLWFLGTGPIKGFALTLMVGVGLSLLSAVTLTRWLINLCAATGWFGRNLFGVKEVAQ